MRCGVLVVLILTSACFAQDSSKSATGPIILDHNRVVIDVDIPLPDGSTTRVRGWVDNGNPDLVLSPNLAKMMGLTLICSGQICSTPPHLPEIKIGDVKLPLSNIRAKV